MNNSDYTVSGAVNQGLGNEAKIMSAPFSIMSTQKIDIMCGDVGYSRRDVAFASVQIFGGKN